MAVASPSINSLTEDDAPGAGPSISLTEDDAPGTKLLLPTWCHPAENFTGRGCIDYARDNYYLFNMLFFYAQVSQYFHKGACIILTKKLCQNLKLCQHNLPNPYTCRTLHIAYECGMSGANID